MLAHDLFGSANCTIRNSNGGWRVTLSDKSDVGPYWSAAIALQVAVTDALLARKHGLNVHVFVEDDYGTPHKCLIFGVPDSPDPCTECETSWRQSPRPARCPIRRDAAVQ